MLEVGHDGKDIDTYLRIMDVATELRKAREAVDRQLNRDEEIAATKERILKVAKETGEKITEAEADTAIAAFYENQYSFKAPKGSSLLAKMYVKRGWIAKRVGIPIVAGMLALGGSWAGYRAYQAHEEAKAERFVEDEVDTALNYKRKIEMYLKSVSEVKVRDSMTRDLEAHIRQADAALKGTEPYFSKYCKDGCANGITQKNHITALNELEPVGAIIGKATEEYKEIEKLIKTDKGLANAELNLDSLIKTIRAANPPKILSAKAENLYVAGKNGITALNLDRANTCVEELAAINNNAKEFATLPDVIDGLYASIQKVSREKVADDQAREIYARSQSALASLNLRAMQFSMKELQLLDVVLKQEYNIMIVSRPGEMTGVERSYTDKNGKRLSGNYIVVEARNSSNNVVSVPIFNEETQKTEVVNIWAERVPRPIYEMIGKDKGDNGRVDIPILGVKPKGYISPILTYKGPGGKQIERLGQITRWEKDRKY